MIQGHNQCLNITVEHRIKNKYLNEQCIQFNKVPHKWPGKLRGDNFGRQNLQQNSFEIKGRTNLRRSKILEMILKPELFKAQNLPTNHFKTRKQKGILTETIYFWKYNNFSHILSRICNIWAVEKFEKKSCLDRAIGGLT